MKKYTMAFIIILFVSLFFDIMFLNHTVDDAFISFRYADNLANGKGFVYNLGEKVEGYTNFLWTILMVPSFIFKIDILIWHKLLGIIFSLLTLFFVWLICLKIIRLTQKNIDPALALIPPLILAFVPSFAIYNVSGMENPLFCFLLTLSTFYFLNTGNKNSFITGLLLGLLTLTRPEGFLFLIPAIAVILIHKRDMSEITNLIGGFLIPVIPFAIFRALYYGEIYPNTYYAKVGVPIFERIKSRGIQYLGFLIRSLPYCLLLVLPLLSFPIAIRKKSPFLFPLLGFLIFLIYIVYVGGDVFQYFRFFSLVLPLVIISIFGTLIFLLKLTKPVIRKSTMIIFIVFMIVWGISLSAESFKAHKELNYGIDYKPFKIRPIASTTKIQAEIGEFLKTQFTPNFTLLIQDIGAIGFYSNLYIIDPIGLIDTTLAHYYYKVGYSDYYQGLFDFDKCANVHKSVRDYILEYKQPNGILYKVDSGNCDDLSISFHYHYLYIDSRFVQNYQPVRTFLDNYGKCIYILYLRTTAQTNTENANSSSDNTDNNSPQRTPKKSKSYILY